MQNDENVGIDRRTVLKSSLIAGGAAVWTVPAVQVIAAPAWAAGSPMAGCGRFTGGGRVDVLGNNDARFRGNPSNNPAVLDDGMFGFELYCSTETLPNNLVVDFFNASGDSVTFHLSALTTVVCTFVDDPTPPHAPVNTMQATGTGRLTGAATGPATIAFTLVDNGERAGATDDTIDATINYAGGSWSTNGPRPIFGGNIQAHESTGSKAC